MVDFSLSTEMNPKYEFISVYVHIPFCSRKCPYCHFFVLPNREEDQALFHKFLLEEWKLRLPLFKDKKIVSIYFGGGTPSLAPKIIESILENASSLNIDPHCEITVEANPEHLSSSLIESLKNMGVNRISLGIQSLDDGLLQVLGRTHDRQKAIEAIQTTYDGGIENITVDLMYELPHQTLSSWETTLNTVTKLPIKHLSLYNLTFEPQTVFFKKQKAFAPHLPSSEDSLQMLKMAVEKLENAGLKRYEISAFAKEGFIAVHNTGYWKGRPFLGLGPSSFSYLEGRRFRNVCSLKHYSEKLNQHEDPMDFEETLPYPANLHELLAIRLRLLEGIHLKKFKLPETARPLLKDLAQEGYLTFTSKQVKLTEKGLLFYDSVAEHIILDCST